MAAAVVPFDLDLVARPFVAGYGLAAANAG